MKIAIGDITAACGLNRQTFYYHFQDKYELLDWIYYEECFVPILDGITFDNWHLRIKQLLDTLKKEKGFYGNVIKNAPEGFRNYLYSITSTLFEEAASALDAEPGRILPGIFLPLTFPFRPLTVKVWIL